MRSRRILAVVLAFAMLAATCGTALAADVPSEVYGEKIKDLGITDVKPADWGAGSIIHMYEAGIMAGDPTGQFRPNDSSHFNESVATVCRVLGIATKGDSLAVTMQKAVSAGVITQNEATNAGRDITRLEMAKFLATVLDIKPKTGVTLANMPFKDASKIPQDQWGLLAALHDAGVFAGFPDGTFGADGTLTRVQLAVLMERILSRYKH